MGKFGETLQRLVKEKGVSYYEVSKSTGISQSTISLYTANPVNIKISNLIKLANYFDVSTDRLLKDCPPIELQKKDTILDFKLQQIKSILDN